MRRRTFIAALGGAAAWPVVARAQQQAGVPVVGVLSVASPDTLRYEVAQLRQSLAEAGFVEGQNVVIDFRWGYGQFDQMPALARELVSRRVDVIVAIAGGLAAAKAATSTIPIVSTFGGDPVKGGFVASLNKPGGNITGVGLFAFSLGPKRFEILHEAVPNAERIAVLVNPTQPDPDSQSDLKGVEAAAHAAGRQIVIVNASREQDFDRAFATMTQQRTSALLVMADSYFSTRREQLVALAARHAIPAIYEWREMAQVGGLMSYGSSLTDACRKLGIYAAQILKGAKPTELPIDQAVKIELVLNLKTAKTLGLEVPPALLARADEVIE
jgi:putative ABC transport system substrate-binding protein